MSADPRALLAEASVLHRAGKVEQAIEAYKSAARLAPGSVDVHRMLALALLQAGHAKDAVRAARQARDLAPRDPNTHVLMGAGLLLAGDPAKALAAFDQAATLHPGLLEAHFQAGNALAALGRHSAAIARFTQALAIDPRAPEALMNRATAYARLERHAEALADCERLVEMQPWVPLHHIAKANTLLEMGDLPAALAAAEAALAKAPGAVDALLVVYQVALARGDLDAAAAAMVQAIATGQAPAELKVRYAHLLRLREQFDAALAECQTALETHPRNAAALHERAEAKRALGDAAGALADADAAIAIQPQFALAQLTRAGALGDLGHGAEARRAVDRALRSAPKEPRVLFARALQDLSRGRWAEGWAGYDQREHILPLPFKPLPFPRWDGSSRPDLLVILGEQGIGDVLHFSRLLPWLLERDLPVRLMVRAGLVPLLTDMFPNVDVVAEDAAPEPPAGTIAWAPMASLPRLLGADPAHWPPVPYLRARADRLAKWAHLRQQGGLLVGVNWQGNPSRLIDVGRSAPLAAMAPLAALPGATLVSLQHGPGSEQVAQVPFADRILTLGPDVDSDGIFLDRAAILAQLDVLVTTDTSAAHLAGALGTRAFVALRAVPDWRWGEEGEFSLFYPSLRLFRQTKAGDWSGPFTHIAQAVQALSPAASASGG